MTTSAIDLEKAFKAGVAAYRKGDYERAIALFNQLTRSSSQTYWLKASMGMTQVYIAQKQWTKAKAVCQRITQKTSLPAPQKWAETTLTTVERQMVESGSAATTAEDGSSDEDKSGFQLIETGSQAKDSKSQPTKTVINRTRTVDIVSNSHSALNDSVSVDSDALTPPDEAPVQQTSMFHYVHLNGTVEQVDSEAESITDPSTDPSITSEGATSEGAAGEGYLWTYANRLQTQRTLGRVRRGQLRLAQIGSAIAFYFLLRFLTHHIVGLVNSCLAFLDRILPFWVRSLPVSFHKGTWPLLIALVTITLSSPWLWDILLRLGDRQKFSISQLRTHSPESASIISRHCRSRRWSLPTLWRLPTDIPLIFSYGWLPRNARLVVSDGFLSALREDEIAVLVAYELSHWCSWHWVLLCVHGLILQGLHQIYWQLALWGNQQKPLIKWSAGAVANLSYGLFWLVRLPGLWAARVRTYYGDRAATKITGNPNALIRGLTKLAFSLAESIERQGYTPGWIESLELLLPVRADIPRQKLYGRFPLAELFAWDSKNPLRNWMCFLDSHPPLGDRLWTIAAYAKHWKLTPEIAFATHTRRKTGLSKQHWRRLLTQGTPYLAGVVGAAVGAVLWGIGAIAYFFNWPMLDWMYRDVGLFQCCVLLGVGVGSLVRINRFFPDLSFSMPSSTVSSAQALPEWICRSELLPVDSLPTKLTGTMLSRPGVASWLGQDLYLRSSAGLMKLHFFSVIGPLGNLFNRAKTPRLIQGESVQVLGWFRRGTHPWLDIDKVRLGNGTVIRAGYPLYSLVFATAATGMGLWLLLQSTGYTG